MQERVVYTRRIAKVVKGGRRLRFNASWWLETAKDRLERVWVSPRDSRRGAQRQRHRPEKHGHDPAQGQHYPASNYGQERRYHRDPQTGREGTGIIAAGAMRAMLELGGVRGRGRKSLGSRNPINIVYATLVALRQLRDPEVEVARRVSRATGRTA